MKIYHIFLYICYILKLEKRGKYFLTKYRECLNVNHLIILFYRSSATM